MRTDNTTTSSAQPKNPKFQTSADLQISPNTESVCFYLQKLLQNLGLMFQNFPFSSQFLQLKNPPGTTQQVQASKSRPIDVPGAGRKEDPTKKADPRDPMAPGITMARHALLQ
jgi:hypothetical protein